MRCERSWRCPGFVAALGPEWRAWSLTMPLKEAAFEVARDVFGPRSGGRCHLNTLVRRADGGWSGDNTDVYGVSQALREAGCTHVASLPGARLGGAARSCGGCPDNVGVSEGDLRGAFGARQETLAQAHRAGLEVGTSWAWVRSASSACSARVSQRQPGYGPAQRGAGGSQHPAGRLSDGQDAPRGFASSGSPSAGRGLRRVADAAGANIRGSGGEGVVGVRDVGPSGGPAGAPDDRPARACRAVCETAGRAAMEAR
jgi:hypothetical protein